MRWIGASLFAVSCFAQVASLPIREMSGAQQTARPFSLAQAFKEGDIAAQPRPRINGIAATEWQADVRTRWSDGSVKFAVISFHADLPASSTIVVDYISSTDYCHLGNLATCQAAALDGAGMLAMRSSAWTGTIEITNGTTQTANARTLINAGKFTYWLRGPIVTQMIVRDSTRASDMGFTLFNGSTIASLHPIFVITAYPAYTAGIRQEFILENSWADNNVDQTYSLAIKNGAGGATTQYSRVSFLHYPGARWHKGNDGTQIWDGTAPGAVEFKWNVPYLIASKALPNYDPAITVGSTTISSLTSIYNASDKGDDFGDTAGVTKSMGATGGRPDIGFVYQHQLRALYSQSNTLAPFLHNLGDVAGHVAAMHYRETRTDNYYCGYSCTGANALVAGTDRHVTREGRRTLYGRNISPSVVVAADRITTAMSGTGATSNNATLTVTEPNAFATGITDGVTQFHIYCGSSTPSACSSTFYGFTTRTVLSHTNNTVTFTANINTGAGSNFSWYVKQTTSGWSFENSHAPSLNYIPYLITGSWWNYDELMWWARWSEASEEPSQAYYGQMYEWSIPNVFTYRVSAWQIRIVAQAAWAAIDGSPEQETSLKKLEWAAEYLEGVYGITDGNYPPANAACPGYTALGSSPLDSNKNRWCFGYQSANEGKSNPLGIMYTRTDIANHCKGRYYARFNCAATSDRFMGAMWQNGYMNISIGWANEAGITYFSKVIEKIQKFAIDLTYANNGSTYTFMGAMYSFYVPGLDLSEAYATTYSQLNNMIEKVGTSTITGAITATSTTINVADYTQIVWKPIWKRTSATAKSITGLSVASGVITITFSDPHGLSVGDLILTSGHTTAAFNTNTSGGAVIATRYVASTPTANSLTYAYVGASAPADGTYTIGSFFAMTPAGEITLQVENEFIHVCGIETDGTLTVGQSVGTTGGNLTSYVCNQVANYATRGAHGSTAAAHSSGATIQPGYRAWEYGANAEHGYNWIARAGYSFMWPYTTASSTGSAAWGWINTYMDSVWLSTYRAAENPTWSVQPRQASGLIITTSGIPSGVVSSAYSTTLAATGNTGAVTWSLPSGSLPAGLSLSSGGVISGTPGAAVATTVTVRATDSTGYRDATFGLGIATSGVVITITPESLTSGTVGTAYSQTFSASGGTAPYSWAVLGGGLPPGLSLSASGNLTGTPTTGGTYNFTIRATDSLGNTADQPITWTINWLTLTITTGASLAGGALNVPYSTTIAATGGDGSYTWTLVGGVFPAGLSLNASTGEISGMPNTAANYSFTLRCTSGDAQTIDKTFTLIVTPPSTDVSFKGTRTRGMAIRCCGRAGSSTADTWDTITTTWAGTTTSWSGT